jgi:pyridoxamine 5'-phosphate oxidase
VRESQLGAWTSQQSQPLNSLEELNERFKELDIKFKGKEVPCPPNWGGFIIVPEAIEFWFGRQGRMHERYKYTRILKGWNRQFLNP